MSIVKSISGIRGTIGGQPGSALTPVDIIAFTSAYASMVKENRGPLVAGSDRPLVVVGRDARISGDMVRHLVCGTLMACGIDVLDIGLASTPTTEMAVVFAKAQGGIILTASHNPAQWNALKLLDSKGLFLSAAAGARLLEKAESGNFRYAAAEELGQYRTADYTDAHIRAVLSQPMVAMEAIYRAGFKVVVDGVNSVGGVVMPRLLEAMGITCICLNCEPTGHFAHNPEPLPQHLQELSARVVAENADLGISVDPDVDRLALVCEDGSMFGEEYTLVSCADYVLEWAKNTGMTKLHTVSNLSSTRALRDVTEAHGGVYTSAAVGEVNVVTEMTARDAIIGGEGNGGVILPSLHPGRDALMGTALFLSLLAAKKCSATRLRATYPAYYMSKNRIELADLTLADPVLSKMKERYASENVNTIDGLKIIFEADKSWVHLRKSNTEPIIRVYAEAISTEAANALAEKMVREVNKILQA